MNLPLPHLLRQPFASAKRADEPLPAAAHPDHPGSKPLFRAPELPTSNQLNNELPFTVNLRPRLRDRS